MKKYRVAGSNKEILLKKVAEKLNVSPERIAHKELGIQDKKIVLEVWVKEEKELEEESNFIEDKIDLEVTKKNITLYDSIEPLRYNFT